MQDDNALKNWDGSIPKTDLPPIPFRKDDQDKLKYSLIPPFAEEEMVKVLMFGANKYGADNWRKVGELERYLSAALRHIAAYRKGDKTDSETGLHHLAHAMCCLSFIVEKDKE